MSLAIPKIYLILGAENSGRRSILNDLLSDFPSKNKILYFKDVNNSTSEYDTKLESRPNLVKINFKVQECKIKHEPISDSPELIIFLSSEKCDPSDLIEGLKNWLNKNNCSLTRIITNADCRLIENNPSAEEWYNACIHFSDYVLVNNIGVNDNKWLNNWIKDQKQKFHPTRFETVKKNCVRNPADVLDSRIYRNTQFFDYNDNEFLSNDFEEDKYIKRLQNGERELKIKRILK